ncbi:TadE family protein [Catenuloplanes japonicus]|uniref:TadE family protein n=1 Tax=Catenuloplanes japonicus TaxID=33876 RepID=UPI0005251B31|nr:TadE family protein [Catenuloplanes japonicus]
MQVREVRRRADRGAAAVETALVLPLLLMVIFAMVDFGRMLNAQIRVTEAAREGARAFTLVSKEKAATVATGVLGGPPSADTLRDGHWQGVTGGDCLVEQNDASYEVVYGFEFITPLGVFADFVNPHVIQLKAKAVMPCRA